MQTGTVTRHGRGWRGYWREDGKRRATKTYEREGEARHEQGGTVRHRPRSLRRCTRAQQQPYHRSHPEREHLRADDEEGQRDR